MMKHSQLLHDIQEIDLREGSDSGGHTKQL